MRRVLFIIGSMSRGGAETQLLQLAMRLDGRGYAPEIAVLVAGGPLEAHVRTAGIPLHALPKRTGPLDFRRLTGLAKLLRERRPDIVHAKLMDANIWGGLAALMTGHRRVVFTELGPGTRTTMRVRFFRSVLQRAGAMTICNSARVAERLAGANGASAKYEVIPNGVADRWFERPLTREAARRTLSLPEDAWIATSVTHFTVSKNVELFIDSAAIVAEAIPDAHFVIVGTGPLRAACEAKIRDAGLASRIHVLGELPDAQPALGASDAFVLSSRSEGMPNALMEALATGLPCVATDVGGCSELIPSPAEGTLVPSEDAAAMAEALLDIHRDPAGAASRAAGGQRHIRAHYSLDALLSRTVAAYDRLLAD